MNFFARALLASLTAAFLFGAEQADASICYVVVASETTPDALKANPSYPKQMPTWVVKVSNDRFAAVIGWLDPKQAPVILQNLKASGRIASDSFCMAPEYMEYITSFGNAPTYTSIAELHPAAVPPRDPASAGGPSVPREMNSIADHILAPDKVENAQSDVVIKGLSWAMTPRQMISTLTARGMTCKRDFGAEDNEYRAVICKGEGRSEIKIDMVPRKIVYDCATINSCGLNNEDAARAMLDFLPIPEFKPNMTDTGFGIFMTYCGFSAGGNKVCTTPSNGIELFPGNPGGVSSINLQ